jgi:hypothetical protein
MSPPETPAGWYPDSHDPQLLRYWDGAGWTEHTAPRYEDATEAQPTAPGQQAAPQAQPPAVRPQAPAPAGQVLDVYNAAFDIRQLPEQQREQYMHHTLTRFPTWVAVVLTVLLSPIIYPISGLFPVIFQGLKHDRLPQVKHDDFTAGKAIGFMFIPFFNWYWQFRFWLSLADKINFQYRLRNQAPPVPRGFILTMCILNVIPYVNLLSFLIAVPIAVGFIQSAANRLADERQVA